MDSATASWCCKMLFLTCSPALWLVSTNARTQTDHSERRWLSLRMTSESTCRKHLQLTFAVESLFIMHHKQCCASLSDLKEAKAMRALYHALYESSSFTILSLDLRLPLFNLGESKDQVQVLPVILTLPQFYLANVRTWSVTGNFGKYTA